MKKAAGVTAVFLIVFTALLAGIYFQRTFLAAEYFKYKLKELTGTDIAFEDVTVQKKPGSADWAIEIQKMLIKNPGKFEIPNMALLRDIQIVINPKGILKRRWHLRRVYAYLEKSNYQISRSGIFNVSTLPAIRRLAGQEPPTRRWFDFQVDRLELKFGKVYQLDFSAKPPSRALYSLKNRVEAFSGVDDPDMLIGAPVWILVKRINQGDMGLPMKKLESKIDPLRLN